MLILQVLLQIVKTNKLFSTHRTGHHKLYRVAQPEHVLLVLEGVAVLLDVVRLLKLLVADVTVVFEMLLRVN